MTKIFDLAIIGSGPAGLFCAMKVAQKNKNLKCALIEFGRPPAKRHRQLEAHGGCLTNSNGTYYINDVNSVSELTGKRASSFAYKYVIKTLSELSDYKITKDKLPKASVIKKINEHNFKLIKNDYIQMYPKDAHLLSRKFYSEMEAGGNFTFHYDTNVSNFVKRNGIFHLETEHGEIQCKKLLLASGRAGWAWSSELFKNLGIIESNNVAKIGLRIESPATNMKDFNKSNCSLIRDDLEIGPLNWNGTIIPEDHYDFASSEFRSNEKRWETKNVSFKLIGNLPFDGDGAEQAERLAKLTFILTNDRISKEKISLFLNDKSKVSIVKEYKWFKDKLEELSDIMPSIIDKGYFHVPTLTTAPPKINIGSNLETEIDNLFVAGEVAGISGLLAASVMGSVVANNFI